MPYRKMLLGPVLMILAIQSIPANAQSLEQQIEELRQKLNDLEQQVKINARKTGIEGGANRRKGQECSLGERGR